MTATISGTKLDSNTAGSAFTPALAGGISLNATEHFYTDISYYQYLKTQDFKTIQFYGISFAYKF